MDQAEHSRQTTGEVKADGNIHQHQSTGDQNRPECIAQQCLAGHGANIVDFAALHGIRIQFLDLFFKLLLDRLNIFCIDILDTDIHFIMFRTLYRHIGLYTHLSQHGFNFSLGHRLAQVILHGKAACKINSLIDSMAKQRQNQSKDEDTYGNGQANPGTILNLHFCSSFALAEQYSLISFRPRPTKFVISRRVITTAVNMETMTPRSSVFAKPWTEPVP